MNKFIRSIFILLLAGQSVVRAQVQPQQPAPVTVKTQAQVQPKTPAQAKTKWQATPKTLPKPAAWKRVKPTAAFVDSATVQTTQKEEITDPSLKGQYEALLSKSKTLYNFKLINPVRLAAFYKSAVDSMKTERSALKQAQHQLKEQLKTIDTLNSQIKSNESSLDTSNQKLDEISFLGISFSKSSYNTIVWSLIIVLALAFAFVTIRSAKNTHEAKYRTELYDEVAKEFQAYKTKANEKEKKLARELQDERNKLDDYKNRG